MKRILLCLHFFVCACLLSSVTALAYIDPSAMTYMIQLIAGVAIAAGAGAGYYFRRIKRKFSGHSRDSRAVVQFSADDDDDTGFGDYELDAPGSAPAAEPAQAPAFQAQPAQAQAQVLAEPPYADMAVSVRPDPFDEAGGTAGLAAENRELRRLLALERQNVEELKRALHICTSPRR